MQMRIGQGFDRHRLTEGDGFPLGGVAIDASVAVVAHSDGDVLLHALIDALLGATGRGDIGDWYPPSDPSFRDASSVDLLDNVLRELRPRWRIVNIDATVFLQRPKLSGYKPQIVDRIAQLCDVPSGVVNVKAKTGEQVGPVGRGEAVDAAVTVLLEIAG